MVNDQAALGHATETYTRTMRQSLREQLKTASGYLAEPNSSYGQEIRMLLAEPDDAPPRELRAHAAKLKQIEDSLDSA